MLMVQDCLIEMVIKFAAIVLFTPLFVFPGLGIAVFGVFLGHIFQKAQLSVKRESR